ncbi:MAG: hypothetical protein WD850_02915 [Candidatus Spechtbacterales bacterium]
MSNGANVPQQTLEGEFKELFPELRWSALWGDRQPSGVPLDLEPLFRTLITDRIKLLNEHLEWQDSVRRAQDTHFQPIPEDMLRQEREAVNAREQTYQASLARFERALDLAGRLMQEAARP